MRQASHRRYHVAGAILFQLILVPLPLAADGQLRIVNGTEVNPPHKYPWIVSLFDEGSTHKCGGVIIDKNHLLTAAHCCINKGLPLPSPRLFALTGLHDRKKPESWSQKLSVTDCIHHEHYHNLLSTHDIALLRVNESIQFSDKVTPVNLPPPDFDVEIDGEVTATAIGWGSQGEGAGLSEKLQQTQLPLITTDTCQRALGQVEYIGHNTSFVVTEGMLCAGFAQGGTNICGGDSGGPLMVLEPTRKTHMQVGIVSWSLKPCARPGTYAVYTRLSQYVHWITAQLQKCPPRTFQGS